MGKIAVQRRMSDGATTEHGGQDHKQRTHNSSTVVKTIHRGRFVCFTSMQE